MLNLINAEWTKLRTTASFYACVIVALVLSLLNAALTGWIYNTMSFPKPLTTAAVITVVLSMYTLVQTSMMVTTEYRFGMAATNFRVAPKRWQLALAKLILGAVLVAVVSLVSLVLGFTVADLVDNNPVGWASNAFVHRALWAVPLGEALLAVLVQGVGWLLRNTAVTVCAGLLMMLLVERVLPVIPKIGEHVDRFLPFKDLNAFMLNQKAPNDDPLVSLGIFVVWALVAWVAGVVLLHKRDA